jgi:hypothetical protein
MRKFVLSLCDYTGNFVQPWVKNGYRALLVDIQHPAGLTYDGRITKFGYDIMNGPNEILDLLQDQDIAFTAAFPPCTDLAISGAKWFKIKADKDPDFQKKAMDLVYECVEIASRFRAPCFIENPVGVISTMWRKPDYIFQPWHYTKHCRDDNYKKKTCLWTSKNFIMPPKAIDKSLGPPDNRIHMMPGNRKQAAKRSITPLGFSKAVYLSNKNYDVVV